MSIDVRISLSMLSTCAYFSEKNKNGVSSFTEPDDSLDMYVEFLDKLSYDWINDDYLCQLCIDVFERRTESE